MSPLVTIKELWPEQISTFYRNLIDWENLENCPLARMMLASIEESQILLGENADPIGDLVNQVVPNLIHRYPCKALLLINESCAGHCRFCFRRASEKTHHQNNLDLSAILSYLSSQPAINEIIFSGGEPLLCPQQKWQSLRESLLTLTQLDHWRFHSRLPIFNPLYFNQVNLKSFFAIPNKQITLVIHCNHALEISPEFISLVNQLTALGVTLLSQSVLLRGVNSDVSSLNALFSRLLAVGVRPYRLYHLDQAPGIGHFRLSVPEGIALWQQLCRHNSNTILPEYYLDLPGGQGKVNLLSLAPADQPHCYWAQGLTGPVLYRDLVSS